MAQEPASVTMPAASPGAWGAFERAIVRATTTFATSEPGTAAESLDQYLLRVRDAVQHAVSGGPDEPVLPCTALAVRVLERLRRDFVEEVRSDTAADPRLAIEVLSALGTIECRLERGAVGEASGSPVPSREAFDLVMEIAHDVRSPITAILFLAETIRQGRSGAVSTGQARQLGLIYTAARGLAELADDLIDYARGHEKLIEPQPSPFSLTECLHAIRDILEPIADEKGLAIEIVVPQAHARVGFPTAIHRIILNLASNAVKYTDHGSVAVAARELTPTRIEFSVRDSGPGIPKSVMTEIFQPFRPRLRGASAVFSSAGLGLSIARRLVSALGGELRVITGRGRGTRFVFELDLPRAE